LGLELRSISKASSRGEAKKKKIKSRVDMGKQKKGKKSEGRDKLRV
jgi:hypothetical protein